MATYIQDTLDLIDVTVGNYAQSVFVDIGGPVSTTIRLGGLVALALLGINVIMQWAPLRVTDFAKWGVRYIIILVVATSWGQFLPFYNMLTNVPSSVGAALLDVSGTTSLNGALDQMVTSIFDFSDRAAEESGFLSISVLSIMLAVVGAIMAAVAILVAGIAKIGLAMAVSVAPLFIAGLLFRGTSELFSSWAKFTLGFALIPLVLAGVMGAIVRIGTGLLRTVDGASTLTAAAPFVIVAAAAIFLMSQVPTMVNGLAGTIVATASGIREARQMAAGALIGGAVGAAAARAAGPTASTMSSMVGAARSAEAGVGNRGRAAMQEMLQSYASRKQARERNQARMATLGRRTSLGADFEAGQAGQSKFNWDRARERSRERAERVKAAMGEPEKP